MFILFLSVFPGGLEAGVNEREISYPDLDFYSTVVTKVCLSSHGAIKTLFFLSICNGS